MLTQREYDELSARFPVGSQWAMGGPRITILPGASLLVTVTGVDWDGRICLVEDEPRTDGAAFPDSKWRHRALPEDLVPRESIAPAS